MFKKKNLESINRLDKAGYVIYRNNKFAITRYYNDSGRDNYFKDIGKCLWMLMYGIISIIGFPFCLLIMLIDFIPKLYFINEDEAK